MVLRVHTQYPNRSPADRSPANKGDALPFKMIVPIVTAWMKEFSQGICLGIDPSQVSPFVEIAIDACEREVIDLIVATMYFWDDVLYVKSSQR